MTKKRLTVRGLFLWAVHIETAQLWITTRRDSMEQAIKKARNVITKEYPGQKIKKVASHGYIDA
jgi:hypothetical protein